MRSRRSSDAKPNVPEHLAAVVPARAIPESQLHFALFMENLPGYAWMKDMAGRYVYINQKVAEDMPPFRGHWFGKTDAELWPGDIAAEYSANDRKIIDTRRALQTVEHYETVQGERRHALVSKFPIIDDSGAVFMLAGISLDVTEQKRIEDLLAMRVRQQTEIMELGQRALTGVSISDLLDAAVVVVAKTLHLDYCGVLELFAADNAFVFRASVGWEAGLLDKTAIPAVAASASGHALLCNEPVIFDNVEHETRFLIPPLYKNHGIVSGIVVPIPARDGPYGVLHALAASKRTFTTDEVCFLQSVTNILATAIQRRSLEQEVLQIAESEQRRIGEDLHDTVCQDLISAALFAKSLQHTLAAKAPAQSAKSGELVTIVCEAAARVREIARGLMPMDLSSDSLVSALRTLIRNVQKRCSIACRSRISKDIDIASGLVPYHLFRIAQEAVNNVIKHSHGKHLWVTLSGADGKIRLTVKDDGIGFPTMLPNSTGMGLHTMRYRAKLINATLSIESGGTGGTIVTCSMDTVSIKSAGAELTGAYNAIALPVPDLRTRKQSAATYEKPISNSAH
jgi:PAS domain S-box-containing protein